MAKEETKCRDCARLRTDKRIALRVVKTLERHMADEHTGYIDNIKHDMYLERLRAARRILE